MLIKKFTASAVIAAFAVWVLIAAAAGCAPASQGPVSTPAQKEKSKMEYRQNPNPKQAYRLTLRIDGAPGPFASMRALAHYDVVNTECLRPPKDNPGGHTSPVPTAPTEVPLERIADNTYTGVVYADQMLDEDYAGRGVCRWRLTSMVVQMKATGAEGETLFIPSISDDKLFSGRPETVYFNKRSYPNLGAEEFVNPGESNRSRFGPSIRDEDLFTITFTPSREAAP
jgi:hypothetical protein